jgi:hypothetical protein
MAITQGQITANQFNTVQDAVGSSAGQLQDQRRKYNFGDRIAELAPEESPFFVYLSQTAKLPTDDSLFRYLEDRTKIDYTSREFLIKASGNVTVTAGTSIQVTVDTADGASVDFLIKGMVLAVQTVNGTAGYSNVILRVNDAPVDNGADTTFTAHVVSVSANVTGYNVISNEDKVQIIGSAYAEGSGAPDTFSDSFDDGFGYTQIFKTAAEITNTAFATNMRGVANEFDRVRAQKMREHKIDIERAMLFNQKSRTGGIQYTEGLVGNIIKNSTVVDRSSAELSYQSGKAYFGSYAQSELTYDALLADFEVLFDPARGGSNERLALASLPVISYFNKMGNNSFADLSTTGSQYQMNMEKMDGAFGHKLMEINTVHGSVYMVKEPLFRGHSSSLMLMADMSKLYYRPLVGNGLNRDTLVEENVQAADEDLRKDMITTEAGLEVCLPESHYLINVEGL